MNTRHSIEGFSSAEHRLLSKVSPIEALQERVMEHLKDTSIDAAEQTLNEAPVSERRMILDNVARSLRQNKSLAEAQRNQIGANLDLLRNRSIEKKPQPPKAATMEKKPETVLDPRTWSPETWGKAKDIAALSGAGIITAALLFGLYKLKKGAKKVKEVTAKGAESSWSFLKWLTVGVLVTGLGFGVWKLSQKYRTISAVADRIKELTANLRKNPLDPLRKKFEKELEELKKLKEKMAGKPSEPEPALSSAPPASAPVMPERAPEAMLPVNLLLLPPAIAAMEGAVLDKNGKIPHEEKNRKIGAVLKYLTNGARVGDVWDCMNGENVDSGKLSTLYSPPSDATSPEIRSAYMAAAEAVVLFLHHRRKQAETLYALNNPGKSLSTLSVEDYLRECGGGYQTLGAFVEHAREFGQAFLDKEPWQKIEQKILLIKDPAIQHELNLIMQKAKEKSASLKERSLADILTFAYPGHMSDFIQNTKPKVEKGTAEQLEKSLYYLCLELQNDLPNIVPLFQEVFPDGKVFTGNETEDKKTAYEFFMQRMSLQQALRIALYDRMIHKGYGSAYILMQLEILRFAKQAEEQRWIPSSSYRIAGRVGMRGIRTGLKAYGDLTAEQVERIVDEVTNTGATLLEIIGDNAVDLATAGLRQAAGAVGGLIREGWEQAKEHPVAAGGATLLAGTAALGVGLEARNTYLLNPLKFAGAMKAAGKTEGLKGLLKLRHLSEMRLEAGGLFEDFTKSVLALDPVKGKEILVTFLKSPRAWHDWHALSQEIKILGGLSSHALKDLEKIARNGQYVRAISRFTLGRRVLQWAAIPVTAPYRALEIATLPIVKVTQSIHWTNALKACGAQASNVLNALKGINIPQPILHAFSSSQSVLEMLIRTALAKGSAGIQYMVKLAVVGQNLAKAAGIVSLGIDALVCYAEMSTNQQRMESAEDPDLKELYALRDQVSLAKGAAGTAFSTSLYFTGIASSSTLVLLPAVPAFMVAGWYHGKLEEASETWLRNDKDWAKLPEGELMKKLLELKPGEHSFGAKSVYGTQAEWLWRNATTWNRDEYQRQEEERCKLVEDANTGARFKICRAYIVQKTKTAILHDPSENPAQSQRRFDQMIIDQMLYLARVTQGAYNITNPEEFVNALKHAELMELSRKGTHQMVTVTHISAKDEPKKFGGEPEKEQFDLADYQDIPSKYDERRGDASSMQRMVLGEHKNVIDREKKVLQINQAFAEDEGKGVETLALAFLSDIDRYLPFIEAKLLRENFPGMADSYERDLARTMVLESIRGEIDNCATSLLENGIFTMKEYTQALEKFQSIMQESPLHYYEKGIRQKPDIEKYRGRSDLLTLPSILKELRGGEEAIAA